ncbi:hypothetical protein, partial [Tritonibacter sp. SIMBA_163]|uniref:hypothetical protein n=1 Tax=Tritonibacter sp. SIMBA_163 TaxID=3080868 RepID=UPI00397FF764
VRPHEITAQDALYQDAVANSDPVSIVVNRVVLPESLTETGPATRDIAVLLDFGAVAGQEEQTIAVWYQRAVPGDEPL